MGTKGLQVMWQLMAQQVKGVRNKEEQKERASAEQSPEPPVQPVTSDTGDEEGERRGVWVKVKSLL